MSREQERMWRLAGRYSAIGIEIAAAFMVGALGGSWLDTKLGTGPWLFLFGLMVGIGASVRAVMHVVSDFKRDKL